MKTLKSSLARLLGRFRKHKVDRAKINWRKRVQPMHITKNGEQS